MTESACLTVNEVLIRSRRLSKKSGGSSNSANKTVERTYMLNEKSPGSVWNVALIAVAIFVGALVISNALATNDKTVIATSVQ